MTTYFAQSSTNINGANVWNTAANGSGSYLTWPPASGDVLMANNKTITVNVSTNLGGTGEVRTDTENGATAGGGFALSDGVTLTARTYSGTATCVTFAANSPAAAYVVGAMIGGTSSTVYAVNNTGTGTLSITGNIAGGSATNAHGAYNQGSGTLNITGSVTASATHAAAGAYNASTGILTISLNATGGAQGDTYGARNQSTGTLTILGSAIGGSGANSFGAYNVGAGTLNVGTAVGNGFGNGSVGLSACPGVSGSTTGSTKVKSIQYGSRGQTPTVGNVYIEPDNANQAVFVKSDLSTLTLSRTDGTDFGNPVEANVRYGVSYALGNKTGTCHVPTAAQVSAGVAVDHTTGTAVLTAANVRDAVGLASANLDSQLSAIPTTGLTAQQVWEYVTRTLTAGGGISAQDVWEYATRSLTEAPDVPTVQEIADQVRTELTPELERVANCATVASTGDQLAALL